MDLDLIKVFAVVVERGSFSGAARELNLPVSSVSRKVSLLEKQLNVRLLERSTRQLNLTDSGKMLFTKAKVALETIQAGLTQIQDTQLNLRGILTVSSPPDFKPWWAMVTSFKQAYPAITLQLMSSQYKVDLIQEGVDVSLRIGDPKHHSIIARKLFEFRHKLVASRLFFKSKRLPDNPDELTEHPMFIWGDRKPEYRLVLENKEVPVAPAMATNEYGLLKMWVEQGLGVAELPPFFCQKELAEGTLIEVLAEYPMPLQEAYIVFPSNRQVSRLSRVFIDYAVNYFRDEMLQMNHSR